MTITHYLPIRLGERSCFAIGWALDVADCQGPWQVKIGESEPASVPSLILDAPVVPPPAKPTLAQRIQAAWNQAKNGQHAESVAEAEQVALDGSAEGTSVYNAACVYSVAAVAVLNDHRLAEPERNTLREKYLVRALELLRLAVQKGFNDLEQVNKDEDLEPLRNRDDFQRFLEELEPKPGEGKKA